MTVDEIKQSTTMQSVLSERGIRVNRGMASCPFHKDDSPSMRIYKDGYRCFSCGDYGDVIQFVMKYDGVDFKTAFLSLGGTYERMSDREKKLAQIKRERATRERKRIEKAESDFKHSLSMAITICWYVSELYEPFSDEWCDAMNTKQKLLEIWSEKFEQGEEVNKADVYRESQRVIKRYYSV